MKPVKPPRHGEPYTAADMEHVHALRTAAPPIKWTVIADRLGRDPDNLQIRYSRWRKGTQPIGRRAPIREARIAAAEAAIAEGRLSQGELAQHMGISRGAAGKFLIRHGLDLEMRQEIANGDDVESDRWAA